ncbi:MAG: hypothetical protein ACOX52_09695 [Verrucomicrobiota bacterium]
MDPTHPHDQIEHALAPLRLCARPPDGNGKDSRRITLAHLQAQSPLLCMKRPRGRKAISHYRTERFLSHL